MKRKFLYALIALMLIASFGLMTALPAAADSANLTVTGPGDSSFTLKEMDQHFSTETIDASSGDTILSGGVGLVNFDKAPADDVWYEVGLVSNQTYLNYSRLHNKGVYMIALWADGYYKVHMQNVPGQDNCEFLGDETGYTDLWGDEGLSYFKVPPDVDAFEFEIVYHDVTTSSGLFDLRISPDFGGTWSGWKLYAYAEDDEQTQWGMSEEEIAPWGYADDDDLTNARIVSQLFTETDSTETFTAVYDYIQVNHGDPYTLEPRVRNADTGKSYCGIQVAIDDASSGDTIEVAAGTFTEALDLLDKGLTIDGAGVDDTIVDASSETGYAVQNFGDGAAIKELTLIGSDHYGFKVSHVSEISFDSVKVENSGRTAFDLNTVDTASLTDIEAVDTVSGFGLMMLDSNNINIENVATEGNAWGGVSIQTARASSNSIAFSGDFDVEEDVALLLEKDPDPDTGDYHDITGVTLPGKFENVVYAFREGDAYQQAFYQESLEGAKVFAQSLMDSETFTYSNMTIYDLAEENYYVIEGMLIQDAIAAATSGDTVNVDPGTYPESITVDELITLQGGGNDLETGTVITPGPDFPNVTIAASGSSATERLVIRDLYLNGHHNKNGFGFADGPIEHVTLQDVSAEYYEHGLGIYGPITVNDLEVIRATFSNNDQQGFSVDGDVTMDGLKLTDCEMVNNFEAALYLYPDPGTVANVDVTRGTYTGTTQFGDIVLLGPLTTASITDVTAGDGAASAILFYTYGPVSDVTITNPTIADVTGSSGIAVFNDTGSTTDVSVSGGSISNCQKGLSVYPNTTDISIEGVDFANNNIQVYDEAEILNIAALLEANDFDRAVTVDRSGESLLPIIWSKIQDAVDNSIRGDTIKVAAGTYTETVVLPYHSLHLIGAGADVVTWDGDGAHCIDWLGPGADVPVVVPLRFEITGFTFYSDMVEFNDGMIKLCKANRYQDTGFGLDFHDNILITPGESDYGLWLCRNSGIVRNPDTGESPVKIHDNIFKTTSGICMSNSNDYDIFNNDFTWDTVGNGDAPKKNAAIFIGSGCTSEQPLRGGHHIWNNDFAHVGDGYDGSEDTYPRGAISIEHYSGQTGLTLLANTIENNTFSNPEGCGVSYACGDDVVYPADIIRRNDFSGNLYGVYVYGDFTAKIKIKAVDNWWNDADGPSGVGPGDGDAVSTKVEYRPWLPVPKDETATKTEKKEDDYGQKKQDFEGTGTTVDTTGTEGSGDITVTSTNYDPPEDTGGTTLKTGTGKQALKYVDVKIEENEYVGDICITISYNDEDLDRMGVNEYDLSLFYYDMDIEAWVEANNVVVDMENNTISGCIPAEKFTGLPIACGGDPMTAIENIDTHMFYNTIQEAVDDALTGQTIALDDGTYCAFGGEEFPIVVDVAGLTIKSVDGAAATIIAPVSSDRSAFEVLASGVIIGGDDSGFTIVSGGRAGIYADEAGGEGIQVLDCIFKSYGDGESRAMYFEKLWGDAKIDGNTFVTPRVGTAILIRNADGADITQNNVPSGMVKYAFVTFKAETFYPLRDPTSPFAEYVAESPSTINDVCIQNNALNNMQCAIRFATSIKPSDHGEPQAQDLTIGSDGVQILGNPIRGCEVGVLVDLNEQADDDPEQWAHIYGAQNIQIHSNGFSGNEVAVVNGQEAAVNAQGNWWNDVAGPCIETNPYFDQTNGEFIVGKANYLPWMIQFDLEEGWNIISWPIMGAETDETSIPEVIIAAYYFNSETQLWGENPFDAGPLDAMYIKTTAPVTMGYVISDEATWPSQKEMKVGWNFVGLAELHPRPLDEALADVYWATGESELRGYSKVISPSLNGQSWACVRDSTNPPLIPTKGYWVFMVNDGVLGGFTSTPIEEVSP